MEGEELDAVDLDVLSELVHLEPLLVVDVDVLLLGDGAERLVVQPLDVAHRLAQVELRVERRRQGVERRDVAEAASEGEVAAVARVVEGVRAKLGQVEREGGGLGGEGAVGEDVALGDAPGALEVGLGLHGAGIVGREEEVVVLEGVGGCGLGGRREVGEVVPEFLVGARGCAFRGLGVLVEHVLFGAVEVLLELVGWRDVRVVLGGEGRRVVGEERWLVGRVWGATLALVALRVWWCAHGCSSLAV